MKAESVGPGLFIVAGPDITDQRDALAYLVEDQGEMALIDAGAGPACHLLLANIRSAGFDPARLRYLIATHAHIDHVGALAFLSQEYPVEVVAHYLDAAAMETGDQEFTAATWYNLIFEPVQVQIKIREAEHSLWLGQSRLICLHTPGHTPGSMSVYLDRQGKRYLFGQDIHGPFHPSFDSDVELWRKSMHRLLALEADVLLEGHYGVIEGKKEVAEFINSFLDQY